MTDTTIAEPSAHPVPTLAKRAVVPPRAQDRLDTSPSAAKRVHDGVQRQLGAGLYTPAQLARWRKVTEAVHTKGGQIFMQLWCVGCDARTADWEGPGGGAEDFRAAAGQAMAAGFDGVELHVNNGLLLEQFLKSGSNQHAALVPLMERRARLLLSVITAVAAEIGADRTGVLIAPASPDPMPSTVAVSPKYSFISGRMGISYLRVAEGAMRGPREDRPFDCRALLAHFTPSGQPAHALRSPQEDGDGAEPARVEPVRRRTQPASVSKDDRIPERARRPVTPEFSPPRREPNGQAAFTA